MCLCDMFVFDVCVVVCGVVVDVMCVMVCFIVFGWEIFVELFFLRMLSLILGCCFILFFVLFSGFMFGLMLFDFVGLEIIVEGGDVEEREYAK